MRNILAFLFLLTAFGGAHAQYQTISSGTFQDDAIWETPPGNPFTLHPNADSLEYYSAPVITVTINHDVVFDGNLLFKSDTPGNLTISIVDGASLTVNGNLNSETVTLQVFEGGALNVTGQFTTDNAGGASANDIIIAGDITIGGGVNNIAGDWVVSSTGTLNITGTFIAGTITNFDIAGNMILDGDLSLNGGEWNIYETGEVSGNAEIIGLDNISIDNNGKFIFTNATSVTAYGGQDFECNGSNRTGQVNFGNVSGACAFCNDGSATQDPFTKSGCYDGSSPLPIDLVYFDAQLVHNEFQFAWQTASEENNDYFTIEYSEDVSSFTQLDNIAGAGNSKSIIDYEYSTPAFPFEEVMYFRLKQTDYDGAFAYSKIVPVTKTINMNDLALYPNPAKTTTLLTLNYKSEESVVAQLVNSVTLNVISNFTITNGQALIDVSNLEDGIYYITISNHSNPFRLLVQH